MLRIQLFKRKCHLRQIKRYNRIYVAGKTNFYLNNAFESHLFNNKCDAPILFVRQVCSPTIVIGKNQNSWIDCDVTALKKDGVNLMRRMTGGGAVYLDEGNLLVGFINKDDAKAVNNNILTKAMRSVFGVEAVASGRNDITVDDNKVA